MDKKESDSLQDQAIKNGTEQQNDANSLSKKSKSRDSNKEIHQFFYKDILRTSVFKLFF